MKSLCFKGERKGSFIIFTGETDLRQFDVESLFPPEYLGTFTWFQFLIQIHFPIYSISLDLYGIYLTH